MRMKYAKKLPYTSSGKSNTCSRQEFSRQIYPHSDSKNKTEQEGGVNVFNPVVFVSLIMRPLIWMLELQDQASIVQTTTRPSSKSTRPVCNGAPSILGSTCSFVFMFMYTRVHACMFEWCTWDHMADRTGQKISQKEAGISYPSSWLNRRQFHSTQFTHSPINDGRDAPNSHHWELLR